MGLKAFSQATEVDAGSDITVNSAREIAFLNLPRNVESYVYWNMGANFFNGDFTHRFSFQVDSTSDTSSELAIWTMSQDLDDWWGIRVAQQNAFVLRAVKSAANINFFFQEYYESDPWINTDASAGTYDDDTRYWVEIERDEAVGTYGTLYARIYSDIEYTTLIEEMTLTLNISTKDFQYIYPISTRNDASALAIDGFVYDYDIDQTETGVAGVSEYAESIPYPFQSNVWFDGLYYYVNFYDDDAGDTVRNHLIAYGNSGTDIYGIPHEISTASPAFTSQRAQDVAMYYSWHSTLGNFLAVVLRATLNCFVGYKDDKANSSTSQLDNQDISNADMDFIPAITVSRDEYVWIAGREGTSPNWIIKAQRNSVFKDLGPLSTWDSATSLKTTGASNGMPQLLAYFDTANVVCLYSNGANLHMRVHDVSGPTWNAETDPTTTLKNHVSYRGVMTNNNKVFLVYRKSSDDFLYYNIYNGSWGSEVKIDNSDLNDSHGFTTCANQGEDESVYIYYYDTSDNLTRRIWNGSTLSGETTLVATVSKLTTRLNAPYNDSHEIPVVYQTDDDRIMVYVDSLTPSTLGTDNTLIYKGTDPIFASPMNQRQVVSVGDLSFITVFGRDHRVWGGVWDRSDSSWDIAWQALTTRFWDLGNQYTTVKDPSNYVYIKISGKQANMEIYKSDFPFGHASFGIDDILTNWTDISPSSLTTLSSYAYPMMDQDDDMHLITTSDTALQTTLVREYDGTWRAPVTIIDRPANYFDAMTEIVGKEPAGQKTLHLSSGVRDSNSPITSDGFVVQKELCYMRLNVTGVGTYEAYRPDDVEMTLPIDNVNKNLVYSSEDFATRANSTAYTVDQIRIPATPDGFCYICTSAGTSAGSPPTFINASQYDETTDGTVTWQMYGLHGTLRAFVWPKIEVIDTDRPIILTLMLQDGAPYAPQELVVFRWSTANSIWEKIIIEDTETIYRLAPTINIDGNGHIWVHANLTLSGVQQIVSYKSTNNGTTWPLHTLETNEATVNSHRPIAFKTGTDNIDLLYHIPSSRMHSELRAKFQVIEAASSNITFWERQRKRSRVSSRRGR